MSTIKAVWSDIGENQTIAINAITDRITIRHRRWSSGKAATDETKDVLVDGYVYTPAVSDMWISGAIGTIMHLVEKKRGETHIGMGVWVKPNLAPDVCPVCHHQKRICKCEA